MGEINDSMVTIVAIDVEMTMFAVDNDRIIFDSDSCENMNSTKKQQT